MTEDNVLVTIIESENIPVKTDWRGQFGKIHDQLKAAGHKPPTPEEVESYVKSERESWD